MLTADDVLAFDFPTGNAFLSGYAVDSVDRWLSRVASTLRAYEGETGGELGVQPIMLASEARSVRFPERRGDASYEPQPVDDAIDMIVATLAMHEAAAGRR